MLCPDCKADLPAEISQKGFIEAAGSSNGRQVETRDDTYFCRECGLSIKASLTVIRGDSEIPTLVFIPPVSNQKCLS